MPLTRGTDQRSVTERHHGIGGRLPDRGLWGLLFMNLPEECIDSEVRVQARDCFLRPFSKMPTTCRKSATEDVWE